MIQRRNVSIGIIKTIYNTDSQSQSANIGDVKNARIGEFNDSEEKRYSLENIGCKTVRSAIHRYGKTEEKYKLYNCFEITAERMKTELLTVAELKLFGLKLYDLVEKMNIRWYDIRTKLNLRVSDLTREDGKHHCSTTSYKNITT